VDSLPLTPPVIFKIAHWLATAITPIIEYDLLQDIVQDIIGAGSIEEGLISAVFLNTEIGAIIDLKLPALEAAILQFENTLRGCEDDDHDGLLEGEACFFGCNFVNHCGNGKLEWALGETCDDGNSVDDDGCTNSCRLPRCGDGVIQNGEECDDGNVIDGDQCSSECLIPDPDGDGFCNNGKNILPCQFGDGCNTNLDCGHQGACDTDQDGGGYDGYCVCPGLKCEDSSDCEGLIDCSGFDITFCNQNECACANP